MATGENWFWILSSAFSSLRYVSGGIPIRPSGDWLSLGIASTANGPTRHITQEEAPQIVWDVGMKGVVPSDMSEG
ncbi:unnamed protein product [Eruca vesicaria subsp. sativa]|uniref:Uncharacterized protein n=1 Tax=Eruca vesicaria subsp. sativa TaxID=29727 RepID=A0ABC8KBB2_ERUVS|nr:unnamed protein product [Eruca vesicaria subsp. sativa]